MKHIIFCFVLSLFFTITPVEGKRTLSFKHFGEKDKTQGTRVMSMFQDSQGFMWFATTGGLTRYDGHLFKNYKNDPNDPTSLSDNAVLDLIEDRDGFLWVSTLNGLNRFDPKFEKFSHYFHNEFNSSSISENHVYKLLLDTNGNIWAGTLNNGINRYNPKTDSFVHYRHNESELNSLTHDATTSIYEDKNGVILVGTDKGISQYEPKIGNFKKLMSNDHLVARLNGLRIRDISEGPKGDLWFSTYEDGLFKFSRLDQKLVSYPLTVHAKANRSKLAQPSDILLDSQGELWVGSEYGLHWFDEENNDFVRFGHIESDSHSISENPVISLYEDKSGVIWIGFLKSGLNVLNKVGRNFSNYRHNSNDEKSISHSHVGALLETQDKELWVGTQNGLNRYNAESHNFERFYRINEELNKRLVSKVNALLEDREGRVWVGSNYGLHRFDDKTNQFIRYLPNINPPSPKSLTNNYVRSLLEDNDGHIWMGTYRGLYQFNPATEEFVHYAHDKTDPSSLSNNDPGPLLQDKNGAIWVGTSTSGLNKYTPETGRFIRYEYNKRNANSTPHYEITVLFEDSEGMLWVGTSNGLSRLNLKTNKFEHFERLEGKRVGSILTDERGYIWIGISDGLLRFDPDFETFDSYDSSTEINNYGFYNGIKLSNGDLVFGGNDGLLRFNPSQLKDNSLKPNVVFTDFLLFNESVAIGKRSSSEKDSKTPINPGKSRTSFVLDKAINKTKNLTLTHEESVFTFEFSALHYANPELNQYAYKLEGLDKEWIYTDYKNRRATYTSIPSGDYVLRVRASNSDGVWNEEGTSINLTILPPPWLSWWAYTIYLTVFISLFIFVVSLIYKRKMAEKERATALAVSSAKENLFANISHEFRTPLTLILGPSAAIKQKTKNQEIKSDVTLIERNARRLLSMVDQVLDLAKLRGSQDQECQVQSIVATIEFLVHSFQSFVEEKQIELTINYSIEEQMHVSMVPDALTKILTNLLSNAFKYTQPGGKVIIEVGKFGDDLVQLSVRDTGCGISPEDQPTIFDRFTRLQRTEDSVSGTGIGLALVKQLVESHQGTISVKSQLGVGSEFTIRLPLAESKNQLSESISQTSKRYIDEVVVNINSERTIEPEQETNDNIQQNDNALILIIEDNQDMRHFIKSALKNNYNVITASNGRAGIKAAVDRVPDLIISDVMMPEIDGFQVSRTLKSNQITSHIPLILLTAKADSQSRIRGWQENVDEYLTKPFDSKELLIRIANLLSIRELLKARFKQELQQNDRNEWAQNHEIDGPEKDWISVEREFIEQYNQVLNERYSEPDLKIGAIATALHMTERQLSRKIKSLLETTPGTSLRTLRLEKASQLLKQGYAVSEVAYSVGFSSHSNFGRYFKTMFGKSPKEYKAKSPSS